MALYALDEEKLIYSANALERHPYRCCGCNGIVKVRKGRFRTPHFYHLALTPSCRLHSKTQDHLLAQLTIHKSLPRGEAFLEKPFLEILRVADLIWEPRKIAFEIQCSQLTEQEAEKRVTDYAKVGYQVVWILDDRTFNRKTLRPAEKWIRQRPSYYATLRSVETPCFYDQFEVFLKEKRTYRGIRVKVHLSQPKRLPDTRWHKDRFPMQVLNRAAQNRLYFKGDLLHKALLSQTIRPIATAMRNYKEYEKLYGREIHLLKKIFDFVIAETLDRLMIYLCDNHNSYY